ncbi:MAG: phosphate-starvation-inducible PsiE family protein [Coriobacteriia bacterium]|nr:phosphate-starvation-inducible PsiE family protein [Coriobacteriia bacterium]
MDTTDTHARIPARIPPDAPPLDTPPAGRPDTPDPAGPGASTRRWSLSGVQGLVVSAVVEILVALVLVVLVWVVFGVARDVWTAVTTSSIDAFKNLSIELLTVFVFIELFHSLSEYMRFRRLRVTHLVDASLAFVLREVWVGMYGGEMDWKRLLALAAMVLVLGAVRTAAVIFSPGERAADEAEA